jgi:Co/Zn/Cd efflux system component
MSLTAVPNYINVLILILIVLAAGLFLILIVTVRRLQNYHNILTANLCVASIGLSINYVVYFSMFENAFHSLFTSPTCTFMYYLQSMSACQPTCAFTIVSVNRYFFVVYPTTRYPTFKQYLRSILCGQWLLGLVLPLPMFARNLPVRELAAQHLLRNAKYLWLHCKSGSSLCYHSEA